MKTKKFIPVVMLLFYRENRYLLTRRVDERKKFSKVWQIPGGGWEPGESMEEALEREIKEELGIKVKNYKFLPKIYEEKRENIHLIFFIFYAPFPDGQKIVLNEEADQYGWFTKKEIKKLKYLPLTDKIIQQVELILRK